MKYDIILWGASGFTGRLVAEYLLAQYGIDKDLKWAMAGRNEAKLKTIRTELGNENIPILTGDSLDMKSIENLVKQTKVICTTVGPYAKYGSNMVEACVKHGVHYCDLTGEVQWIRRMIDKHHEAAKANGTKIVHCCGFDSIPSEMGVLFLQNEAKKQTGEYCKEVKFGVKIMKGGMSGGTLASLNYVMEEMQKDDYVKATLENPYGLNPKGEQSGPDQLPITEIGYDEDFGSPVSPFVMAAINCKVVRRSNALKGYPYGRDFRYSEVNLLKKNTRSARIMNKMIGLVMNSKPNSMVKKISNYFLPKPGEGPTKEQRENGFYNLALLGKFRDGNTMMAKVKGDKDPGYGSTSKMLGESAVCLAKDDLGNKGGVLTPSVAMGETLRKRLADNAGLSFEIVG